TSRSALTPTTSSAGLSPGTQERRPIRAALLCVHTPDARFANYGDHIYLCDHAEDGHSVMVWVKYYHEDGYWKTLERWNWWGPKKYNGCKVINLRVKEQTWVEYYVCLGDHAKPGGKPPKVITGTCSVLKQAYNNG